MSIDAAAGNYPMKQQGLEISHVLRVDKKVTIEQTVPIQLANLAPDQYISVPKYSPLTADTQTMTAFYAVPQSSFMTIL